MLIGRARAAVPVDSWEGSLPQHSTVPRLDGSSPCPHISRYGTQPRTVTSRTSYCQLQRRNTCLTKTLPLLSYPQPQEVPAYISRFGKPRLPLCDTAPPSLLAHCYQEVTVFEQKLTAPWKRDGALTLDPDLRVKVSRRNIAFGALKFLTEWGWIQTCRSPTASLILRMFVVPL